MIGQKRQLPPMYFCDKVIDALQIRFDVDNSKPIINVAILILNSRF